MAYASLDRLHEAVHLLDEPEFSLLAEIAIHPTLLGRAASGGRVWRYAARAAVVQDALRLSRGMTYMTDRDMRLVGRTSWGAQPCRTDMIHCADVDVFLPCALGGTLNAETVRTLKATIICGAANSQLAEDRLGETLTARGILYAPNHAVDASGITSVAAEWLGESRASVDERVHHHPERLSEVMDRAAAAQVAMNAAVDQIVEELLADAQPVFA